MWQQLPWLTFRVLLETPHGRPGQSHNKLRTQKRPDKARRAALHMPRPALARRSPSLLGTSADKAKHALFCLFYLATLCVSIFDLVDTCNYTTFLLSLATRPD